MHPIIAEQLADEHRRVLYAEAALARLAVHARLTRGSRVVVWRNALGFRLVEVGLRLVVGHGAHPPSPDDVDRGALQLTR